MKLACFSSSSRTEVSCSRMKSLKVSLLSKPKWKEKYFHSCFDARNLRRKYIFVWNTNLHTVIWRMEKYCERLAPLEIDRNKVLSILGIKVIKDRVSVLPA